MNSMTQLTAIALTSLTFAFSAPIQAGNGMGQGMGQGLGMGQDAEFQYAVKHSNFMPTLMAVAMKNKSTLNLSNEQIQTLKNYHAENSPSQREDMKNVVKLEKQAAAASLTGDLDEAQKLGQQSIALRQTILNQKLRCHQMMSEVLSADQYAQLIKLAQ